MGAIFARRTTSLLHGIVLIIEFAIDGKREPVFASVGAKLKRAGSRRDTGTW
jgi:hypothetical protein